MVALKETLRVGTLAPTPGTPQFASKFTSQRIFPALFLNYQQRLDGDFISYRLGAGNEENKTLRMKILDIERSMSIFPFFLSLFLVPDCSYYIKRFFVQAS